MVRIVDFLFIYINVELTVHALLEGDERLGLGDAGDMLDLVVEDDHEVLVVFSIDFDEHRVRACSIMAFYDLGDFLDFAGDIAVEGALLELYTYVGACVVAKGFGINVIARARNNFHVDQSLEALMDRSSRHAALDSHVLRRDAGVLHDDAENLSV